METLKLSKNKDKTIRIPGEQAREKIRKLSKKTSQQLLFDFVISFLALYYQLRFLSKVDEDVCLSLKFKCTSPVGSIVCKMVIFATGGNKSENHNACVFSSLSGTLLPLQKDNRGTRA
jgi:hypothetical protein